MKKNYRNAFEALKKIGAPVFERSDLADKESFGISGEDNYPICWADYYEGSAYADCDDSGVNKKIVDILEKYGLHAEWDNPGSLSVWEE